MLMAMKKCDSNSMKLEIEAFNGRGDSNNIYSAGYHTLSEIEVYGKGKNVLNLIAETKNLGNSGVEVISAFATIASQVERSLGHIANNVDTRGGNSRMNHQSAAEEVDDIGDEDVDGEFANEDLDGDNPSTSSISSTLSTVKSCFIKPLFERGKLLALKI